MRINLFQLAVLAILTLLLVESCCNNHKEAKQQNELETLLPGKKLVSFSLDSVLARIMNNNYVELSYFISSRENDTLATDRFAYFPVLITKYPVEFIRSTSDSLTGLNLLTVNGEKKNYYVAAIPWRTIDTFFVLNSMLGVELIRYKLSYLIKLDSREDRRINLPYNFPNGNAWLRIIGDSSTGLAKVTISSEELKQPQVIHELPSQVTDGRQVFESRYHFVTGEIASIESVSKAIPSTTRSRARISMIVIMLLIAIYLLTVLVFVNRAQRIFSNKDKIEIIDNLIYAYKIRLKPDAISLKTFTELTEKETAEVLDRNYGEINKIMNLETMKRYYLKLSRKTFVREIILSIILLVMFLFFFVIFGFSQVKKMPDRKYKLQDEYFIDDLTMNITPEILKNDKLNLSISLLFAVRKFNKVPSTSYFRLGVLGTGRTLDEKGMIKEPSGIIKDMDYLKDGYRFNFNNVPDNPIEESEFELACDTRMNYTDMTSYEGEISLGEHYHRAEFPYNKVEVKDGSSMEKGFIFLRKGKDSKFPYDQFSVDLPFDFNRMLLIRKIRVAEVSGFNESVDISNLPDLILEEAKEGFESNNKGRYKVAKGNYFNLHIEWRRSWWLRCGIPITLVIAAILPYLFSFVRWFRKFLKMFPKFITWAAYAGLFTFLLDEYNMEWRSLFDHHNTLHYGYLMIAGAILVSIIGLLILIFRFPPKPETED
ncbi:MAG: hypothetical protein BGO54_04860 [Sphingobacteriales bacterium 46-32]|nr:MAG: hypothetical protein BGO54_04860 [Sphingobacteriales bacterium 46-32]